MDGREGCTLTPQAETRTHACRFVVRDSNYHIYYHHLQNHEEQCQPALSVTTIIIAVVAHGFNSTVSESQQASSEFLTFLHSSQPLSPCASWISTPLLPSPASPPRSQPGCPLQDHLYLYIRDSQPVGSGPLGLGGCEALTRESLTC